MATDDDLFDDEDECGTGRIQGIAASRGTALAGSRPRSGPLAREAGQGLSSDGFPDPRLPHFAPVHVLRASALLPGQPRPHIDYASQFKGGATGSKSSRRHSMLGAPLSAGSGSGSRKVSSTTLDAVSPIYLRTTCWLPCVRLDAGHAPQTTNPPACFRSLSCLSISSCEHRRCLEIVHGPGRRHSRPFCRTVRGKRQRKGEGVRLPGPVAEPGAGAEALAMVKGALVARSSRRAGEARAGKARATSERAPNEAGASRLQSVALLAGTVSPPQARLVSVPVSSRGPRYSARVLRVVLAHASHHVKHSIIPPSHILRLISTRVYFMTIYPVPV